MEYRFLGKTGLKVSNLSYGASSLGGVFHSIKEADGIKTVHTAIDNSRPEKLVRLLASMIFSYKPPVSVRLITDARKNYCQHLNKVAGVPG